MLRHAGTCRGNGKGDPVVGGVADLRYDDVPATAGQLPRIRHALTAWAQQVGVSADEVHAVALATYEAMANVVTHAYPHHQGTFDMHAVYHRDQRYVNITVSDRGRWRPPPPDQVRPYGMGLQLIRGLAVEAAVDPGAQGATVHMAWPIPGDS